MIVRKTISTFYYALKNYLRNGILKYYLVVIQTLCKAILQREYLQNDSYKRKYALPKRCLKMNFKIS
jgi:hypothetical protein